MNPIVRGNTDWLIANVNARVDPYGNAVDADENVLATADELTIPGLTPGTVPHE